MSKLIRQPEGARLLNQVFGIEDDFLVDLDTTKWTTTASDSGAITVGDTVGGRASMAPSDGTVADNDEIYLLSANENFLFANKKAIWFEARIQFTEANTDDANIAVGLMNAVAANAILDDGAGPKASYSGAVIYKVDGETVWRCQNSVGTSRTTTVTTTTAGGSSFQTLQIEVRPQGTGFYDVVFWIDGVEVAKHKDQALGSPTEMQVFAGVKNGGANLETLVVDYIAAYQLR